MAVKKVKSTSPIKDSGFSRPYGPLGAQAGTKIAKAIKNQAVKKAGKK